MAVVDSGWTTGAGGTSGEWLGWERCAMRGSIRSTAGTCSLEVESWVVVTCTLRCPARSTAASDNLTFAVGNDVTSTNVSVSHLLGAEIEDQCCARPAGG
jgi:hypothetical protein